ncbi:MAG: 2,3-bisphosphoglycerate-independent phosphoglycerate mutase, partial [Dehalococcoidia bacterium]|nr:2,3-bisphosphoglycerate-independent phosphoglycerate mutase [Dehalococcoidia bacterium]
MPIESVSLNEFLIESPSKIVLMVIDGLGGLPDPKTGKSELETAHLPNLRALAKDSALGRTVPVTTGIAPGSGAGHLALFGYDPVDYYLKRGAMEVIGIGLKLESGEIAARGNLCTIGPNGLLADRRAGRPKTSEIPPILDKLMKSIKLDSATVRLFPLEEHRFAAIFRGE